MSAGITIMDGFEERHRATVAKMFWDAFEAKLHKILGPAPLARSFIESVLDPLFAISAVDENGEILGVAGYKTADGALVGGELSDMTKVYGTFGGLWRGLFLHVLERPLKEGELLMDGIFVTAAARGRGIGTLLLNAVKAKSRALGDGTVRLDVIDINPRAKALYQRHGFVKTATQSTGPLKFVFGFSFAETMIYAADGSDVKGRRDV